MTCSFFLNLLFFKIFQLKLFKDSGQKRSLLAFLFAFFNVLGIFLSGQLPDVPLPKIFSFLEGPDRFVFGSSTFLFWSVAFTKSLERGGGEKGLFSRELFTPSFGIMLIGLFSYGEFFYWAFIFGLAFLMIQYSVLENQKGYLKFLFIFLAVAQMLLLKMGGQGREMIAPFLNLGGKVKGNENILILMTSCLMFFFVVLERKREAIAWPMKFLIPLFLMKASPHVVSNEAIVFLSYGVILFILAGLSERKKVDLTFFLYALSLSLLMSPEGQEILPFYYLVSFVLGEISNRLPHSGLIRAFLLMPFVNPFVTVLFLTISSLHVLIALIFILYYAKVLSLVFLKKERAL